MRLNTVGGCIADPQAAIHDGAQRAGDEFASGTRCTFCTHDFQGNSALKSMSRQPFEGAGGAPGIEPDTVRQVGSGQPIARFTTACTAFHSDQFALPDIKLRVFHNAPLVVIVLA